MKGLPTGRDHRFSFPDGLFFNRGQGWLIVDPQRIKLPRQSYIFFMAILLMLLAINWTIFKPFVIFMATGVFVAVLAQPIDRFIEKRMPRRISAVITMLTVFVLLTLPVIGLGLALANDVTELGQAIRNGEQDEWIADGLNSTIVQESLALAFPNNSTDERNATVYEWGDKLEAETLKQLGAFGRQLAAAVPQFFLAMTVILFVVYYILTDGDRLLAYLRRASPLPAQQVDFLMKEANNGVHAVFVGQILTSVIQGGLGGIGFLIAGVPGAVVWAAVMAVLSLLPVVGAFIVWVPAVIFLFFQWSNGDTEIWRPIFLLIWGIVVVSQVDNFIRPRLIGDRANIHPLFVLVGVLGGVAAFGFIGLFLGPLVVGVTLSVLKVWEQDYLDVRVGPGDPTARHPMEQATLDPDVEEPEPESGEA